MQHMILHAFLIECLTNLHAGSGDNNYGVVDKQVQRDSISPVPVINASSLKGALREYFEKALGWEKSEPEKLERLFGSDKGATEKDPPTTAAPPPPDAKSGTDEKVPSARKFRQGDLRFFEARLISIPVRGTGSGPSDKAFYRATSNELLEDFNRIVKAFPQQAATPPPGITLSSLPLPLTKAGGTAITEYGNMDKVNNNNWIGLDAVEMKHSQLNSDVLMHLPIIARNSLDNGQSTNLWYEEVVPRESRFVFFVAAPEALAGSYVDSGEDFRKNIVGKTVQIGANATVGYGYCKITQPQINPTSK